MLFVYVAAARLSVTSGASPPFHRNWDDSKTTQQKHYVGATSCHAISVHVINLPTLLYCITYWLADNLGTLFLRSDSASSSTATPSISASTTPALKRFKFLPEKLQQSWSADDWSQSSSSSTCATMHAQIDQYLHELRTSLPEEDAITFWRRRQAAYSLLAPLAQDLVAAPASQAYVERVFSVCRWLTAGHRNRLS